MKSFTLIGMPSSGKTTKGMQIAKRLGKVFIDTDFILTKHTGMTPAQIVDRGGRAEFLKLQDEIISAFKFNNMIIATGGGIIYCPGAMKNLKKRSRIIFLNTPFEVLEKRVDPGRSLSGGGSSLKEIFDERLPLYKSFADIEIICEDKEEKQIVDEIITKIRKGGSI